MSKRVAGHQITRERLGEDDDRDEREQADPTETASADVLATRKIAQPRSRRRAGVASEETSSKAGEGETKASNPFMAVAASQNTEPVKANPFGSLQTTSTTADKPAVNPFGAISTTSAFSFNTSAPSFSFKPSSETEAAPVASTTSFSFGKAQSEATKQADETQVSKPSSAGSEATQSDQESPEYKRLLRMRSLNVAFRQAVSQCLDADAFADLSVIAKEYLAHQDTDAEVSVPVKAAEAKADGTGLYPSFNKPTPAPSQPSATSFGFGMSKPSEPTKETDKSDSQEQSKKAASSSTPTFHFTAPAATPQKTTAGGGSDFRWTPETRVKFADKPESDNKTPATKSAFGFSNPLASPAPAAAESADDADTTDKPKTTGFDFSKSSATGFSFGQASAPSDTTSKTPVFNFASGGSSSSLFGKAPPPSSGATPTFSFGGTKPTSAGSADTAESGKVGQDKTDKAEADGEAEADGDNMPEEPTTNAALIAQGAGEEEEEALWQQNGRVYKFVDSEGGDDAAGRFVDMGKCNIKLNKNNATGKCRLIARAEGAGAIRMNARLYPHFRYTGEQKASVKVSVMGEGTKVETWLVRVREPAEAKKLVALCNENKENK